VAEAKKKSFTRTDVILTAVDGKGKSYELTPTSIGTVNLTGMKVSGEDYYVKKAVALGATKA
tara:strand:+ start:2884 stop:3069 length:186 start_codon:yes stop_codon:yes gene_type:complete